MAKKSVFFDKTVCALLALLVVVGIAMFFYGQPTSLDAKLYYTGSQARSLLASFSQAGVDAYVRQELLDLIFICSYSALFFVGFKKAFPKNSNVKFAALLPGFFDFVETFMILYALKNEGVHEFFNWLGFATFLKWTVGALVFVAMTWGLIKSSRTQTTA